MRGTRRPSDYAPVSDDVARRREMQNMSEADPNYIGTRAVAAMIGTSAGNLWTMRRSGRFPVKPRRRLNKRPMWAVRDVQRWMDVGRPHHRTWRQMERLDLDDLGLEATDDK